MNHVSFSSQEMLMVIQNPNALSEVLGHQKEATGCCNFFMQ